MLQNWCIFGRLVVLMVGHYVLLSFVFKYIAGSTCIFNIFTDPAPMSQHKSLSFSTVPSTPALTDMLYFVNFATDIVSLDPVFS